MYVDRDVTIAEARETMRDDKEKNKQTDKQMRQTNLSSALLMRFHSQSNNALPNTVASVPDTRRASNEWEASKSDVALDVCPEDEGEGEDWPPAAAFVACTEPGAPDDKVVAPAPIGEMTSDTVKKKYGEKKKIGHTASIRRRVCRVVIRLNIRITQRLIQARHHRLNIKCRLMCERSG